MAFLPDNKMYFNLHSDSTLTSSPFPDDTGVWVHWSFVYNKIGNAMSIFRNGVQTPQAPSSTTGNGGTSDGPSTATGAIHLGVYKDDTANSPFNGKLDELRVYADRALTEAEVASMMTNPLTNDVGLVLSMTFDGSGGGLGKDSSCRGVGDATSVTAVPIMGKECGIEDSSSVISCSR